MSFAKLRPVGSPVPRPEPALAVELPWSERYRTEFVDSGTSALSLAIACARAERPARTKPEVILPAYGCPDLVAATVAQGATPVLVDLEEDRPWLSLAGVRQALSEQTLAVVAVDFLGLPERLEALSAISREAGAALIEDSAQCFPPAAAADGLADFAVLSFGRGKPINLMGGGALLVRNDHAEQAVDVLSEYPPITQVGDTRWQLKRLVFNLLLSRPLYGLLERLPFLGIGETRFKPLEQIGRWRLVEGLLPAGMVHYESRRLIDQDYCRALAGLEPKGWVRLPEACSEVKRSREAPLLRYSVLAPSREVRDAALDLLNERGVSANAFYGSALPAIEGVQPWLGSDTGSFPQANSFAERLLTLPTHGDVRPEDLKTVSETLLSLR